MRTDVGEGGKSKEDVSSGALNGGREGRMTIETLGKVSASAERRRRGAGGGRRAKVAKTLRWKFWGGGGKRILKLRGRAREHCEATAIFSS